MRQLHDATASSAPPGDAVWHAWFGRGVGKPDIIGNCDAAPWNIVSRNGMPVALIDWEVADPVERLSELAMAAWNNAQLYDDDVAARNGLADAAARLRQVRAFVDGYGLAARERRRLAGRIIEFAAQSAANEVIEQNITPETPAGAPRLGNRVAGAQRRLAAAQSRRAGRRPVLSPFGPILVARSNLLFRLVNWSLLKLAARQRRRGAFTGNEGNIPCA